MFMTNRLGGMLLAGVFAISAGCATQEQTEQLGGAAVGAVIGCGLGALIGGDSRGCAAGAAIGAVAGFATIKIKQYNEAQVRSGIEDRKVYGAIPGSRKQTVVKSQSASCTPGRVRPGEDVRVFVDYSLQGPAGADGANVTTKWTLKQNGKKVADLNQPKPVFKEYGGHTVDMTIPIPPNTEAGTYEVQLTVKAGGSSDVSVTEFEVAA